MALYPKNSRMMNGDFHLRKYILSPNSKDKVGFCDHEAATPLFIEIADIHTLYILYAREKMAAMSSDWGLLKPEMNLCEHYHYKYYACLLPMQQQW